VESAERWRRIEKLFYAALELEPQAASTFLEQACGGDTELLREVQSLLNSSKHTLGFAKSAVLQVARQQIVPLPAGKRIGAYEVMKVLGEGGMGTVYLATRDDGVHQQQVAIKLIQPWFGRSQRILRRFATERVILANLNHPSIARLLDAGTNDDGVPYLVMEYVNGLPIDVYCYQNNLLTDGRLQLFCTVCEAVEHAHRKRVVHRDIKPANILVTSEGVPKLLDFGIAKLLDPDAKKGSVTRRSEQMMTPEYSSPEQMSGGKITTATDVYALGVLLYELLTGRHPFQLQGKTPLEIGQIICEYHPEPPSRAVGTGVGRHPADAVRKLSGDLDDIVLMAMRKQPWSRYTSVSDLSRDVTTYLNNKPLQARTDTRIDRAGKFVRRHKIGLLVALLAILVLIAFALALTLRARNANRELYIAVRPTPAARRSRERVVAVHSRLRQV
jgi:eukaryotic-like serine/threonine-protein kinase